VSAIGLLIVLVIIDSAACVFGLISAAAGSFMDLFRVMLADKHNGIQKIVCCYKIIQV
jgi:hypothetical protein